MMQRATIRTRVEDPHLIAEAIRPDNTSEMDTSIIDGAIETTIQRETTRGLRSTVDDYVLNLSVAVEVAQHANEYERNDERRHPDT